MTTIQSTETIWLEFQQQLKYFIVKRINRKDDAEDILQNVFIKIHKNVDILRDDKKVKPWLYTITRNSIIDFYRSQKDLDEPIDNYINNIPDESDDDNYENEQLSSCINSILKSLSTKDREALKYTDYQGHSQKELANQLNISVPGAKSRVQRARKNLKASLKECCEFKKDSRGHVSDYIPKKKCDGQCGCS